MKSWQQQHAMEKPQERLWPMFSSCCLLTQPGASLQDSPRCGCPSSWDRPPAKMLPPLCSFDLLAM
uniref:Uncharacterized protein n=1 Tax=Mustela putorius furo TaxID=9669 RepID=M3Y3N8_MUSPF